MAAKKRSKYQRGMSLIEASLAIGMLALIGTLTWGSIARSFDAYETVKDIDGRYHNVRVAMNRIAKELSMAYLTAQIRHSGRERVVEQVFVYENGSPFNVLHFSSFSHQVWLKDAKESDQAELTYFGARDPDNKDIINLMRREAPRIDNDHERGGRSYIIAEDIKDFGLRFYDERKDKWTDEWSTEKAENKGRLPNIVEIRLTVLGGDGKPIDFITKTRINLTTELQ